MDRLVHRAKTLEFDAEASVDIVRQKIAGKAEFLGFPDKVIVADYFRLAEVLIADGTDSFNEIRGGVNSFQHMKIHFLDFAVDQEHRTLGFPLSVFVQVGVGARIKMETIIKTADGAVFSHIKGVALGQRFDKPLEQSRLLEMGFLQQLGINNCTGANA